MQAHLLGVYNNGGVSISQKTFEFYTVVGGLGQLYKYEGYGRLPFIAELNSLVGAAWLGNPVQADLNDTLDSHNNISGYWNNCISLQHNGSKGTFYCNSIRPAIVVNKSDIEIDTSIK